MKIRVKNCKQTALALVDLFELYKNQLIEESVEIEGNPLKNIVFFCKSNQYRV